MVLMATGSDKIKQTNCLEDTTMVLNGHYDGRTVIFDEPVPGDIPAQTPVRVQFEIDSRNSDSASSAKRLLAELAKLAAPGDGLPPDYSEQHDHYVKGLPRK